MPVKKICICDECGDLIERETEGFIIKGNVYVANTEEYGGIIGQGFPFSNKKESNTVLTAEAFFQKTKEYCYHTDCLIQVLHRAFSSE